MNCEVCNVKLNNPDFSKNMLICDDCHDSFECMSASDKSWGEAWSEFEKANPDKICTSCMDCGAWVALEKITEDDSCQQCGGYLNNGE
ncbi:hypothetical protein A7A69_07235 [Acinetobacter sp. Ac_1271]|nr:hypothetical protein [Acinetobacter guerrae]